MPAFAAPFVGLFLILAAELSLAATAQTLALDEALRIALARDAVLAQYAAQAKAAHANAIAAGALPDPELSLGIKNVPTDSFSLDAEPMTQVTLAVRQRFPAGDTAQLREVRGLKRVQIYQAMILERRLSVRREVRSLWLRMDYIQQALTVARATRSAFHVLLDSLLTGYAGGVTSQSALLRAQGQAGAFTENVAQLEAQSVGLQGELARWVGPAMARQPLAADQTHLPMPAVRPLSELERQSIPKLGVSADFVPADYATLLAQLPQHPLLAIQQTTIASSQASVALAKEAYAPRWMFSLQYGARQGYNPVSGAPASDLVSAVVSMSLPLFTADRQDQVVVAERAQLSAAKLEYANQLRQLRAELISAWAQWTRYRELEVLYSSELIPAAMNRVATARAAYTNGETDFETVVDAQLAAFDTRTNALQITRERALAQTNLLYLAGGDHE